MLSSDALSQLFTLESLLSLHGAATAAVLVPNVLVYLVGAPFVPYAKWVSFAIAAGLAFLAAGLATEAGEVKWVVAAFNAFLIFAAAVGVNESFSRVADRRAQMAVGTRRRPPVSWF